MYELLVQSRFVICVLLNFQTQMGLLLLHLVDVLSVTKCSVCYLLAEIIVAVGMIGRKKFPGILHVMWYNIQYCTVVIKSNLTLSKYIRLGAHYPRYIVGTYAWYV